MLPKLKLTSDALQRVKSGHPWVFTDGFTGDAPTGSPVLLIDHKDKIIAFGLKDSGDIAVRVLGKRPSSIKNILKERIAEAISLRKFINPSSTNCYRLINGAGDGLPGLIVDRYSMVLVLRIYATCWESHLEEIIVQLQQCDGITSIFRKYGVRTVDGRQGGDSIWGKPTPEKLIVTENNLQFLVRPSRGQKTGFFLDQREHRQLIRRISHKKTVVNLFAYTGGFSLYAVAGGAKKVYTVDIAEGAIEDAKENFRINGFDPDNHIFLSTDAFNWVAPESPDLLICDPPSLSKGKRSDKKAWQAYHDLAQHCSQQLKKGSMLASASCTARLTQKEWEKAVTEGIRKTGEWSWCWRSNEPIDHPISIAHSEGRYLKFALLQRRR